MDNNELILLPCSSTLPYTVLSSEIHCPVLTQHQHMLFLFSPSSKSCFREQSDELGINDY